MCIEEMIDEMSDACYLEYYTEQKKLAAAVSRIAANINQICRRINSTGRCYEDDVAELKARQAEIWELLKVRQKDEL